MPFPAGVQTVTVTAGASGYRAPDGSYYTGTLRFTPSVSRVVSAEHGIIALGPVNITLGASGQFTQELLATDADGFEPSGWTYRVDELFTGAPGRAWNISLPASVPTVALPSLSEVESSSGVVSVAAVQSVNGETGDVVGLLEAVSNLSDVASAGAARTNLGLGGAAVLEVGTTAGTVAAGNDARLSDARTPTAHAASHGSAGGDPVTLAQSQISGLTNALAGKADLAGATFTGNLTLSGGRAVINVVPGASGASSAEVYGLKLGSSFAGGENDADSTGRLELESYQRAQHTSTSGQYAHYGEVIRIYSRRWDSKQMIAWYGPQSYNADGTPATADTALTWMGAHYEANDHASVHGHWSLETPDTAGNLQTRFEVRIWDPTTGAFGMDRTIAKFNAADVVVDQSSGSLQLSAAAGTAKNLYWTNDSLAASAGKRWALQADSTAESGSNVGTDFRVNRYSDLGAFVDSPVFIKRSTGAIGIGNVTSPAARLDVSEAGSRHTVEAIQTTSSTISFAAYSGILGSVANRYVDYRVSGDSSGRLVIFGDGKHEWGDGGAGGRDTNLYRDAANSLKTDDALTVALAFKHLGTTLGFYGATAAVKPTVSGAKGGNAALGSLITALATLGLITDSTTA